MPMFSNNFKQLLFTYRPPSISTIVHKVSPNKYFDAVIGYVSKKFLPPGLFVHDTDSPTQPPASVIHIIMETLIPSKETQVFQALILPKIPPRELTDSEKKLHIFLENRIPVVFDFLVNLVDNFILRQMIRCQKNNCVTILNTILKDAFVNLAQEIEKNKNSIVDYTEQNPLFNAIAFFANKIETHMEKWKKLPDEIQKLKEEQEHLLLKLFPDDEQDNEQVRSEKRQSRIEKSKILDSYPKKYSRFNVVYGLFSAEQAERILSPNKTNFESDKLHKGLFVNLYKEVDAPSPNLLYDQMKKDAKRLLKTAERIADNKDKLGKLWEDMADDLLLCLFPDKLKNLPISGFLPMLLKKMHPYEYLQSYLAEALKLGCETLYVDKSKKKALIQFVEERCPIEAESLCFDPSTKVNITILSFLKNENNQGVFARIFLDHLSPNAILLIWNTLFRITNSKNESLGNFVTAIFDRIEFLFIDVFSTSIRQLEISDQIPRYETGKDLYMFVANRLLTLQFGNQGELLNFINTSVLDELTMPPQIRKAIKSKIKEPLDSLDTLVRSQLLPLESLDKLEALESRLNKLSGSTFLSSLSHWTSKNFITRILPSFQDSLVSEKQIETFFGPLSEILKTTPAAKTIQSSIQYYAENSELVEKHIRSIVLQFFTQLAEVNPKNELDNTPSIIVNTVMNYAPIILLNSGSSFEHYNHIVLEILMKNNDISIEDNIPATLKIKISPILKDSIWNHRFDPGKKIDEIFSKTALFIAKEFGELDLDRNAAEYKAIDEMLTYFFHFFLKDLGENESYANILIATLDSLFDRFFYKGGKINLKGSSQIGIFKNEIIKLFKKVGSNSVDTKKEVKELLIKGIVDLTYIFSHRIALGMTTFEKDGFPGKIATVVLEVFEKHFSIIAGNTNFLKNKHISYKSFIDIGKTQNNVHPATSDELPKYDEVLRLILDNLKIRINQNEKVAEQVEVLRTAIHQSAVKEYLGEKVLNFDDFLISMNVFPRCMTREQRNSIKELFESSIKNEIRKEFNKNQILQQEKAYIPMAKIILKTVFPKGEKDLRFLPEELQNFAWTALEGTLLPQLLSVVSSLALQPKMITKLLRFTLLRANRSLQKPIRFDDPIAYGARSPEIQKFTKSLLKHVLSMAVLPDNVKKLLIDQNGDAPPEAVNMILDNLEYLLNPTALRSYISATAKVIIERDWRGKYMFDINSPDPGLNQKKMEEQIKVQFDNLAVNSIFFYLRSLWAKMQYNIDQSCKKLPGIAFLKRGLDIIFRFIFFTIIGTILSILFFPGIYITKKAIQYYLSTNKNKENILKIFTQIPVDQPGHIPHDLHLESLMFNLFQKISEVCDTQPAEAVANR
jgi:hypothetical protein